MTQADTPILSAESAASADTSAASPARSDRPRARTGVSGWWRAATVFLAILLCIGLAAAMSMFAQFEAQMQHMQTQLKTVQQIKYISILADDKGAPAMLATLDPQDHTLQLQRLNAVVEGQDDTMQLWAISATGRPVSLGTLTSKIKTQRLNASDSDLAPVTQLAISVENKGGVDPAQGPRLPYLFRGAVVQKAR